MDNCDQQQVFDQSKLLEMLPLTRDQKDKLVHEILRLLPHCVLPSSYVLPRWLRPPLRGSFRLPSAPGTSWSDS